ncbi:MAG: ADP-forming succinate--CoA ligase subunit beta, partial [Proteobacteria bacterium]|nr:ADP-forming succinate--CoA ligase subunit beta [Pseudomonadota bacterium]
MNLHEYQAKQLFAEYGVPVAPGDVARSAAEAVEQARKLGGDAWLVKAQVHAGGRGKAGGIKFTRNLSELKDAAQSLIGSQLITTQSAPDGQPVNCVLIAAAADIAHELYLGAVIDRASRRIAFMASRSGGMDIEVVAATTPEKIVTVMVDPVLGLQDFQCRTIAFALAMDAAQRKQLQAILHGLYRLINERDLSLVEINPLAILADGSLCALDAKINVDDNALYRQQIAQWRDASQEDDKERRAKEFDLSYVTLDGNIACMVNGAGLAMATMDVVKLNGGEPANFLDVGGGATKDQVATAFRLILSDSSVKGILVNIFGGILRCSILAEGIVAAARETHISVPLVVRLEGTEVKEGRAILSSSDVSIITATTMA